MQHSSLLTLLVALLVIKIPIVAVRLHTMLPSFQASTHTAQTDVASTQQCPEGTVDDLAEGMDWLTVIVDNPMLVGCCVVYAPVTSLIPP